MKPECSVTQSFAIIHLYKWGTADALSGKKTSLVRSNLVMTISEGAMRFCLIY